VSKTTAAAASSERTDLTQEWFTTAELATWLSLSPQTLYVWRHRGDGPTAHRVGKHLRYRRADVEAWLTGQRGKPSAAA